MIARAGLDGTIPVLLHVGRADNGDEGVERRSTAFGLDVPIDSENSSNDKTGATEPWPPVSSCEKVPVDISVLARTER